MKTPRFDLFAPGTTVNISSGTGMEKGVVVDRKEPTRQELLGMMILQDSWHERVPVRWDKNNEVTWILPEMLDKADG